MDMIATSAPSESSHVVMAGADCDTEPPLAMLVATSGCVDFGAGDSCFEHASASIATRPVQTRRVWMYRVEGVGIMDAAEAKVLRDPSATHRGVRRRADHGVACTAGGEDSVRRSSPTGQVLYDR